MTTAIGRRDVCRRSIRFEFVTFPFLGPNGDSSLSHDSSFHTTRMGTGRRDGFVRCVRIVYYARCSAIDASCREGVERGDSSRTNRIYAPCATNASRGFSVSLSASRRFEKVSSTKRKEKKRKEKKENTSDCFLPFRRFHTPNARRRFRWFWKFFLSTGKKTWGNVVPSVSRSSLARARVLDGTRRRRVATHLACRFRWNHPGRDHPPTRE